MDFENIYISYGHKVYRLCLGFTGDADWAKDLTQDTFIQVWKHLKSFRGEATVGTWIYRIAVNVCLRQLDVSKRMKKVPLPESLEYHQPNPGQEELAILHKCITELRPTQRLLISMVLEELPYAQIADILGITEGNVRVKVHRIKQILAEVYKKYEEI